MSVICDLCLKERVAALAKMKYYVEGDDGTYEITITKKGTQRCVRHWTENLKELDLGRAQPCKSCIKRR